MSKVIVIFAENYKNLTLGHYEGESIVEAVQKTCDEINKEYYNSDEDRVMMIEVEGENIEMSSLCFDRVLNTTLDKKNKICEYMSEVYQNGRIQGGFKFKIIEVWNHTSYNLSPI